MAKRLSSLFSLSSDNSQSPNVLRRDPVIWTPSYGPPNVQGNGLRQTTSAAELGNRDLPSLPPPPSFANSDGMHYSNGSGGGSRPGSRAGSRSGSPRGWDGSNGRPQTPTMMVSTGPMASPARIDSSPVGRLSKKKSWLPSKPDKPKYDEAVGSSPAWIAGLREHIPYDLGPLLRGERVGEVWNEQGDTYIHLFPKAARRGPSFKIRSALFVDSKTLTILRAQAEGKDGDLQEPFSGMSINDPAGYRGVPNSNSRNVSNGYSNQPYNQSLQQEKHIYMPLELEHNLSLTDYEPHGDDLELICLYRNFFAFLQGGSLIATPRQASLFSIFLGISTLLNRYGFTNSDGSTWGDIPNASFQRYADELRLADVRYSREKTIEAIVLGENMRSWPLYNEGFAHAAGRLDEIKSIQSPKFIKISAVTANRLERAHLDVEQRLMTLRTKLEDFDFPSMFAGIANSQTATESKLVGFKAWKSSFADFRKFTVAYYKKKYGAWPPKASSKKNNFEESGLNRMVLLELYQDFTDLYDVLVDRSSLTPRTTNMPTLSDDEGGNSQVNETIQHALRRVEDEYDRAVPPVLPPIPFDVPILPAFSQSFNPGHTGLEQNSGTTSRTLKDAEINEILLGSYNRDCIKASPWIQEYFNYERRLGKNKTLDDIVDSRCGQWLFMYAVLQSLPMTVVDARGLEYTNGIEYFVFSAPRGGRSWMKEDTSTSRAWYNVGSGGGVVSLPADLIDHSVEGIYRRSHCWTVATEWAQQLGVDLSGPSEGSILQAQGSTRLSPRVTPRHSRNVSLSTSARPISPERGSDLRSVSRNSMGLEALEAPPPQAMRPVSVLNPNLTFDDILGSSAQTGKEGKRGRK